MPANIAVKSVPAYGLHGTSRKHPKNVLVFRRAVFALGTAFSLLLIFLPVVGNLVAAAFGPGIGGQCE